MHHGVGKVFEETRESCCAELIEVECGIKAAEVDAVAAGATGPNFFGSPWE